MRLYRTILGAMLFSTALCAGTAQAQNADVGLVNMLAGDVSYAGEGVGAARAYMKVRQGDRFTLSAGAALRVVYFQGGRQETWKGPTSFKAGSQQSEGGTPAEVSQLPSSVPQKISQLPELIQIARLGRTGGVMVRGAIKAPRLTPEQQAEVKAAKDTYGKMRAQSTVDDITPELFIYCVLQDYLMYDDMKPVVDEMAKRQPNSGEVQELAAWVKSRTQP